MNSLNKAQIIGNLTRDPDLRKTQNDQSVCTVGVATNRNWTDSNGSKHEEAEFHNVVCWGRLAEIVAERLKKGSKVFFEGRLRTRNWEDDAGIKHYRTEIVADDMIILSPRSGGSATGDDSTTESTEDKPVKTEEPPSDDMPTDEVPF